MKYSPFAKRLSLEKGTLYKKARCGIVLIYPSPYYVGMSSLGFQSVYRQLNELPDIYAERAFLPDTISDTNTLLTYETSRPASNFKAVAFSISYELEITGFFECMKLMGIPYLREKRNKKNPLVICGGPLTFSNPVPLSPFADIIVMGEAEELLEPLMNIIYSGANVDQILKELSLLPGFYIPEHHGDTLLPVAKCNDSYLPARSAIQTPDTVLSDMFLMEIERGCSRGCSFCVMRRSTNMGMRIISMERIFQYITDDIKKIGLVGAAVSDHPRILQILEKLVNQGKQISLSSLRSDRLNDRFIELLKKSGYRTLTIASDGASERLRKSMLKKIAEKHLLRTTKLATKHKIPILKLYMMVGVPEETNIDLDELIYFTKEQVAICKDITKISLGIAPFVAKRNTPLDKSPFVGIRESEQKIKKLRTAFGKSVTIRATSSRWAWAEYKLAQGDSLSGHAAFQAWASGNKFSDWQKAYHQENI